jgi:hypothetical protein
MTKQVLTLSKSQQLCGLHSCANIKHSSLVVELPQQPTLYDGVDGLWLLTPYKCMQILTATHKRLRDPQGQQGHKLTRTVVALSQLHRLNISYLPGTLPAPDIAVAG